ncbi:hypothetical protein [Flavobacterium notoginsengisoli]|uniref:hypothetical protein n=1 Tax=Flavobacterium notoginsengisoli TaxID=1478199 RepID=UPI0036D40253
MENLNGGRISGRNCMLMGAAITVLAVGSGGAAFGSIFAAGAIGGFFTAAASDCF